MFPIRAAYRAILPVPWRDPSYDNIVDHCRGLEQACGTALDYYDARVARLGASVLIRETWY